MVNNKTIIVVGAGASVDFGLPTGNQLREKIHKYLDIEFDYSERQIKGDPLIVEAIRQHVIENNTNTWEIKEYLKESIKISKAIFQAISIDNFIDNHKGNEKLELCGKLAICRAILEEERKSKLINKLSSHNQLDYQSLDNNWINYFFKLITENATIEHIHKRLSSVAFVIFNYDRCVEHFLFMALQNYYGISEDRAAELISIIDIYHPYGTVGKLPWQKPGDSIDFGGEPSAEQLLKLSSRIRTFTESYQEDEDITRSIQNVLDDTTMMIYLGFAFHPQNMKFLTENNINNQKQIDHFATTFGMSMSDEKIISSELMDLRGRNIEVRNIKCEQLFINFWRSLSLSRRI